MIRLDPSLGSGLAGESGEPPSGTTGRPKDQPLGSDTPRSWRPTLRNVSMTGAKQQEMSAAAATSALDCALRLGLILSPRHPLIHSM